MCSAVPADVVGAVLVLPLDWRVGLAVPELVASARVTEPEAK
jgi:hypothetical protein